MLSMMIALALLLTTLPSMAETAYDGEINIIVGNNSSPFQLSGIKLAAYLIVTVLLLPPMVLFMRSKLRDYLELLGPAAHCRLELGFLMVVLAPAASQCRHPCEGGKAGGTAEIY